MPGSDHRTALETGLCLPAPSESLGPFCKFAVVENHREVYPDRLQTMSDPAVPRSGPDRWCLTRADGRKQPVLADGAWTCGRE